jgi:hypothetical protein
MSQWITDKKLDLIKIKHWTGTVVITVGNYGYRKMISNLLWNLETTTDLYPHTIVFSYDRKLIDYISRHHPTAHTMYLGFDKVSNFNFREAVAFKENNWDALTLYKLYAIWWLLSNSDVNIFYTDADIYYIRSPIPYAKHEILNHKMLIQEGVVYGDKLGYCSGMLYVPKNKITLDIYNPSNWNLCNTDDENYLKMFIKSRAYETEVGVFRNDQFPVGSIWRKGDLWIRQQLKTGQFVAIHFNYIKGIESKITKMKEYKMWIKAMTIVEVPEKFQPDLNGIVKSRRGGHTFPPHQKDKPQIEMYAHHFITNYTKTKTLLSNFDYLPIYWTSIGCNGDSTLKSELNTYVTNLLKSNPNRNFWTIVQHCKGIMGSCGVDFPPDRIRIMGTTKQPEKVLSISFNQQGSRGVTTSDARSTNMSKERLSVTLPLICAQHPIPLELPKTRTILASFIGNVNNHALRKRMDRLLKGKDGIVIETGDYKIISNISRFRELMINSIFALCPRGVGSTSYRFAESMQFGCIPVYISDDFSLPFQKQIDWKSCCLLITPDKLQTLYEKLRKIPGSQIKAMQQNVHKIYNEFMTLEKCCEQIIHHI